MRADATITKGSVAARTAAALLGGYAFVWGAVTLGTVLGVAAGLPYEDAQRLMYLIAFLLYAAVFCWAFVARRASAVWAVLLLGGAAMTALGWLGSRALA